MTIQLVLAIVFGIISLISGWFHAAPVISKFMTPKPKVDPSMTFSEISALLNVLKALAADLPEIIASIGPLITRIETIVTEIEAAFIHPPTPPAPPAPG